MNNEKKAWLSFPYNFDTVKVYSFGMNIPGLYDYPAYQANRLKFFENTDDAELRKTNKQLGAYGLEIEKMVRNFKKFPVLPDSLWLEYDIEAFPEASEYIFRTIGGGLILNKGCADVVKQFKLGESTLTPVYIHEFSTNELWDEAPYFFLNLCEHRKFLKKNQNNECLEYFEYSADDWEYTALASSMENNVIDLEERACQCDLDLWHDPHLRNSYFMSNDLYQALNESGYADAWSFVSRKI